MKIINGSFTVNHKRTNVLWVRIYVTGLTHTAITRAWHQRRSKEDQKDASSFLPNKKNERKCLTYKRRNDDTIYNNI